MKMIDMSDIGPLIRQLRYKHRWTQKQLADKLWVDTPTVDEWEHGADMSFVDVVSVFQVLGAKIIIKLPEDGECKYWAEG